MLAVPKASAQIGTTNVAAGPGSHPFHAVGRMYLAGPFKGAPLSLAAVTPALAGPYDYGTVVVRVAVHVDPRDAHVRAVSDTVHGEVYAAQATALLALRDRGGINDQTYLDMLLELDRQRVAART